MSLALTHDQRRIVQSILAARLPPGASVRAFGSRVKSSFRPYSDLDIAVKGNERLTLTELADLAEAFTESDLPFKVDVVDWRTAGSVLQAIIDRDGVQI